jgi:TPR repeat protein
MGEIMKKVCIGLLILNMVHVWAAPSHTSASAANKATSKSTPGDSNQSIADKMKEYIDKQDYKSAIAFGEKESNSASFNSANLKKSVDSKVALYLGKAYFLKQDYTKAVKYFEIAANKGEALAMLTLGNIYGSGVGVKQDYAKAVKWYKKAVGKGNMAAMNYLGLIYRDGIGGIPTNHKMAVKLFTKAAKLNSDQGFFNLGYMHQNGVGEKKDYKQAISNYVSAANLGNVLAMSNLAYMYEHAEGVKQSYHEALNWYMLAAAKGDANAECSVGEYYFNGKGVKNNHVIAKNWFLRGQQHGCKVAGEYLAKISSEK